MGKRGPKPKVQDDCEGMSYPEISHFAVVKGGNHLEVFENNAPAFLERVFDSAGKAGPGADPFHNEVFMRLLDRVTLSKKESGDSGELSAKEMKVVAMRLEEYLDGRKTKTVVVASA